MDYQKRLQELESELQDKSDEITELRATKRQIKAELDIRLDESHSNETIKSRILKSTKDFENEKRTLEQTISDQKRKINDYNLERDALLKELEAKDR